MKSHEYPPTTSSHPVKLIATDLDGTFLGADGVPSPDNCDAVLRAAEVGVPTIFATGRPARWLQPLSHVRAAHPTVITSNGALVVDMDTADVLHAFPVDTQVAADVLVDIHRALPRASFAVEYVTGWGRDEQYPMPGDLVEADHIVSDPLDLLVEESAPLKLLVRADMSTIDLAHAVIPIVDGRLSATFSVVLESGFLELSRTDVSKASALSVVLDDLHVSPQDVAAFGDMPNDLPMLDLVGHPFIMDNAHSSLIERGFPQCGHHDDSAFARTVRALLDI
ncbi:MAG: Cof-type HAD-IIB family hydrolase [Propionibacteriaceae bacterium]|nr:Cof-type HAD-IIB family hydrolase [Propionibacteriaceae bacterium]